MPISAVLFGGRRASVVPLVFQSRDWQHGVFLGSIMSSETTAAAAGEVGKLRRDPFAMLPFCGYNMADYFSHWLAWARAPTRTSCPRSSTSTGSCKGADGRFLWPGYGENSRVLEWVFERVAGRGEATETPDRGGARRRAALNTEGLGLAHETLDGAARGRRGRVARRGARTSRSTTPSSATASPPRCATSSRSCDGASASRDAWRRRGPRSRRAARYDTIGVDYAQRRREEPSWARELHAALGDARERRQRGGRDGQLRAARPRGRRRRAVRDDARPAGRRDRAGDPWDGRGAPVR